ncbi:MAG TPA: hypothetical protein VK249_19090 [Anaerolineales bacterium]|nr:hypothetical protein [Anaerolineales bacterium]
MKQIIRYAIVLILLFSILWLAKGDPAGASVPADQSVQSVRNESQPAADPDKPEPGTVKPPPGSIVITQSGTYSVGGFCTITVTLTDPDVWVEVRIMHPLPRPLPDGVHAVRQGCLVTYHHAGERIDELTSDMGTSNICFAALPKELMKIHFHDTYAGAPTWSPLGGPGVVNGMICGVADHSGTYVATFQKP